MRNYHLNYHIEIILKLKTKTFFRFLETGGEIKFGHIASLEEVLKEIFSFKKKNNV